MHNKFSLIYLIFSVLFLTLPSLNAQTIIDTEVVSGKWTRNLSPYIITRDILLPYGASLAIEEGVRVEFAGYFSFTIKGALLAIGTPKDSISFSTTADNKHWKGIKITRNFIQMDDDSVFFAYTSFSNALNTDSLDEEFTEIENGGAFYIKNFNYFILLHCNLNNNISYGDGGAVYMSEGAEHARIEQCVFENNLSFGSGGAVAFKKTYGKITDTFFLNNKARNSGGAIFTSRDKTDIFYNIFKGNIAEENGGALMIDFESKSKILDNIFQENMANNNGGAIQTGSNSASFIQKNRFSGNVAQMYGGAVNVDDFGFPLNISNNLIFGNSARFGGALSLFNTTVYVFGNTIVKNSAIAGAAVFMSAESPILFSGNILYYNASPDSFQVMVKSGTFPPSIEYCCIQNGVQSVRLALEDEEIKSYWMDIIDSDPLFMQLSAFDFKLQESSPCIDVWLLEDENIVLPEFDLAGEQRKQNFYPDIGAFEFTLDF